MGDFTPKFSLNPNLLLIIITWPKDIDIKLPGYDCMGIPEILKQSTNFCELLLTSFTLPE